MVKSLLFILSLLLIGNCGNEEESNYNMKDAIKLNSISEEITVEKGQILSYYYDAILSADLRFGYEIADESIVKHIKTETHQVNDNPMDDGGDGIDGIIFLKAKKEGSTKIVFTSYLHGEINFEDVFIVTVK